MFRAALWVAALVFGISACSGPEPGDDGARGMELEPCRLRGDSGLTSVAAECGRISVPENPEDAGGASIGLFVARIPALNRQSANHAFTILAGGPGQAATRLYPDYAAAFDRIHRYHDIVLVDQRGTGQSAALDCDYDEAETLEFTPELSAAVAAKCLAGLTYDPRFFTTSVAVNDLDRVRELLGYQQLDLYGVSYGTRVAQHYLRRYPQRVRTVVIDGVVPADAVLGPDIAPDAQAALQNVFVRCEADNHCSSRFPEISATFERLSVTLKNGPVDLTIPAPVSGDLKAISFDYNTFAGAVRLLSYTPTTTALLPLLLHEADANANWLPLAAQAQMTMHDLVDSISAGMHNAVVCTEDAPFFKLDADKRAALTRTYLGTLQVDSLVAICDLWPGGSIDPDFHEPLISDVPVMLLSGTDDPVTPPRNGDQAAAGLSNSLHIIGKGHGHGMLTRGCVPGLIAEFVDTASLNELDISCVDADRGQPFFTSFSGPEP